MEEEAFLVASEWETRVIVLADIEGFGLRSDSAQHVLHKDVYDAMEAALRRAGVDLDSMQTSDRGDGMLMLLPPNLGMTVLLREMVRGLDDTLIEHRRRHSEAYRMRLRVGIGSGQVMRQGDLWTGRAINELNQLVNADQVKKRLKGVEGARMVFVVGDHLYHQVVQGYHSGIDPAVYESFDLVTKHQETLRGWLTLPGFPTPDVTEAGRSHGGGPVPEVHAGAGGSPVNFNSSGTNYGPVIQGVNIQGINLGR